MPIYEYQCQACHKELEALQKISDEPLLECPDCGEPSLKKKISAAAFRLKGAGWYETDFKTGNKKNLAGDSAGSGSGEKSASSDSPKESSGSSGASKSSESKKTA
jgi:putative FmdB family regulatory protein